ncbi:g5694 [Coccomyxa elongata]
MTGTEGFKAVALEDPGRAMGKAWLHGFPSAQSSEGLSRAIATMNFERGLVRGVKCLGYLYEEPPEESTSDDEGFGQNADLDDGQLTAPGWQTLYSDCVSDVWSTDNEDYEDDISGDEPDVTVAARRRNQTEEDDEEGVSDDE